MYILPVQEPSFFLFASLLVLDFVLCGDLRNRNRLYSIGNYILDTDKLLHFYRWGGGGVPFKWSFGWLTGKDNDLVCVKPQITTSLAGEISLSPVCSNRPLAFCAFIAKSFLLRVDHNLRNQRVNS